MAAHLYLSQNLDLIADESPKGSNISYHATEEDYIRILSLAQCNLSIHN